MKKLKTHFLDRWLAYVRMRGLKPLAKLKRSLWLACLFGLFSFAFLLSYVLAQIPGLPSVQQLENYAYELPTTIYDNTGQEVYQFFDKKRELLGDKDLPPNVVSALIASEDTRFYEHYGIDPIRILKAMLVNIIHFGISQGASTITQQTAKLFFLTPEKSFHRKINEVLLALKLEHYFTKQQILGFYLNKAFFGRQSYGIEAAAKTYFSKKSKDLNLAETATLIGLLPAPSRYSPTVNIDLAQGRRNLVLSLMEREKFITSQEKETYQAMPMELNLSKPASQTGVSFYAEEIRRYLVEKYGAELILTGGLKVYSAMNYKLQVLAQQELESGLVELERRHGYHGPLKRGKLSDEENDFLGERISANDFSPKTKVVGQVSKVVPRYALIDLGSDMVGYLRVETSDWAVPYQPDLLFNPAHPQKDLTQIIKNEDYLELRVAGPITTPLPETLPDGKKAVEVELFPTPSNNGGIVSVDMKRGYVLAMSGGYSFGKSQFNRVTQSRRQVGSAFKPFVYLTALEGGYTPASILDDSPVVYENLASGNAWIPKNYGESFTGYLTLRDALVYSKNIPTIKLASDIGIKKVIATASLLGVSTANMPDNLSVALGSGSISLWEMVRAYSVFGNMGNLVDPILILKVTDRDGKVLEENKPNIQTAVILPEYAFIMNSLLQDVNTRGTGAAARALPLPSGGKTGTTNNNVNAWFVGFYPDIITGVYIGNDSPSINLGKAETGARSALPIWLNFMQSAATFNTRPYFERPPNLESRRVSYRTGKLICNPDSNEGHLDYFITGTAPTECDQGGAVEGENIVIHSDEDPQTNLGPSNSAETDATQGDKESSTNKSKKAPQDQL